jgi:hypothetical protein
MSTATALTVVKRVCQAQSDTLTDTVSALECAEETARRLAQENENLRQQLADFAAAAIVLMEKYQLETAAHMTTKFLLEEARKHAGLPWQLCGVDIATVSYERLRLDPRFTSNIRAMTSFWSVEALDAFFEVVIGFSDGELPCRYTPGRARVIGPSTTSIAEHKNFMFFVLYIIRTGATSFALAGMLFGLDHASATYWSVAPHFHV